MNPASRHLKRVTRAAELLPQRCCDEFANLLTRRFRAWCSDQRAGAGSEEAFLLCEVAGKIVGIELQPGIGRERSRRNPPPERLGVKEGRRHDLGEGQDHRCSLAASPRTPHPHGRCRRLGLSLDVADPHLDRTAPRALEREKLGTVALGEVSRRRFARSSTRQRGGISSRTSSCRIVHHDRQTHGNDDQCHRRATIIIIQGSAWPRSRP